MYEVIQTRMLILILMIPFAASQRCTLYIRIRIRIIYYDEEISSFVITIFLRIKAFENVGQEYFESVYGSFETAPHYLLIEDPVGNMKYLWTISIVLSFSFSLLYITSLLNLQYVPQ